ncbi:MAG: serine/threonine-protein kinase [Anaerolineae bacterium]|nr:serine/threonine-protein kinase [Anaerolineae bacterium]
MIGQKIGQYQIISVIGQGGMATVYKAYQPAFDRHVAIKVLGAQLSQDPTFIKRFQREAKVVARIEHRSIVPIYGYGEHDGLYYIVMRLIEGGTLRRRIHQDRLSLPLLARIIGQVAEALDYAHQRNVIHRDLKPSNVLLDKQNNGYLTDFGIAKMVGSNTQVTASGVVGTPSYMSPEQCQGKTLGPPSDIYALGAILFETLTGKVPYIADTPLSVMYMHVRGSIPSACAVNPKLPPAVDRVIVRALAKRPDDRYPTAVALAADFREIVGGEELPKPKKRGLFSRRPRQKPEKTPPPSIPAPEVEEAPPTVLRGVEPVKAEQNSPPTIAVGPVKQGLPKAVQSIMVGFGGMALLVALVSAGWFGLSLLKNGGSSAVVPTRPPIVTLISITQSLTQRATETVSPVATFSSTPSLSPTSTFLPTSPPTSSPSVTPSVTPSRTPTNTLTPTATLTSLASNTPSPVPTLVPGVLPPPAGGGRLAFASNRYGDYDVFLIDSDRSNLRQITTSPASDYSPAWSPDGRQLALVSSRDGDAEIWIVNVGCVALPEGCERNLVQLTFNMATDIDPAWSPNGQQIAYASNKDGDFEIYVMNADGSNIRAITDNSSDDFSPQWSPDGTKIVYHGQTGSSSHLYSVQVAGSTPEQLTSAGPLNLWPDWAPDGSEIAYTATNASVAGARALFILDLGTGQSTQLLDGEGNDEAPAWAPDGEHLAFSSDRGGDGNVDLYILDVISSAVEQLTSDAGENISPDWQPLP